MKKKISRIISFILAAQMLLAPVTAFADSNVITNITGSAAYLAAASGPTTMKTDGKTFAIEADVYVCTNPE